MEVGEERLPFQPLHPREEAIGDVDGVSRVILVPLEPLIEPELGVDLGVRNPAARYISARVVSSAGSTSETTFAPT